MHRSIYGHGQIVHTVHSWTSSDGYGQAKRLRQAIISLCLGYKKKTTMNLRWLTGHMSINMVDTYRPPSGSVVEWLV